MKPLAFHHRGLRKLGERRGKEGRGREGSGESPLDCISFLALYSSPFSLSNENYLVFWDSARISRKCQFLTGCPRISKSTIFCHSEFISESVIIRIYISIRFRIESGMTILGQPVNFLLSNVS